MLKDGTKTLSVCEKHNTRKRISQVLASNATVTSIEIPSNIFFRAEIEIKKMLETGQLADFCETDVYSSK